MLVRHKGAVHRNPAYIDNFFSVGTTEPDFPLHNGHPPIPAILSPADELGVGVDAEMRFGVPILGNYQIYLLEKNG